MSGDGEPQTILDGPRRGKEEVQILPEQKKGPGC
jgi:hypothetical protein